MNSAHQRVNKHHVIYLSDIRKADPKKWKNRNQAADAINIMKHPLTIYWARF